MFGEFQVTLSFHAPQTPQPTVTNTTTRCWERARMERRQVALNWVLRPGAAAQMIMTKHICPVEGRRRVKTWSHWPPESNPGALGHHVG